MKQMCFFVVVIYGSYTCAHVDEINLKRIVKCKKNVHITRLTRRFMKFKMMILSNFESMKKKKKKNMKFERFMKYHRTITTRDVQK